jgi:type IV pilus assembly protein PilB
MPGVTVDTCLREAIEQRASSVHFEGSDSSVIVRVRVDGVLHRLHELAEPSGVFDQLRAMASIQADALSGDGRFVLALASGRFAASVSIVATTAGQSAHVHVASQRGRYFPDFTFEALGLGGDDRARLEAALARPGLVVLAGPTRSGKQPILYASLCSRNDGSRKILSMEWALRDRLQGIDQVELDDDVGYNFPHYLRVAGRMDVDLVGIGELVDYETVEQTFRLVARGKTAITTVHVPSAAAAFGRLLSMGQEPYVVAEHVTLVQAQRMVRLLCEHCKEPAAHRAAIGELGLTAEQAERAKFFSARGCARCDGRGFRGAALVVESLEVTPAIRERIVRRDVDGIRGPRTLREGALELAVAGRTTPAEALLATT